MVIIFSVRSVLLISVKTLLTVILFMLNLKTSIILVIFGRPSSCSFSVKQLLRRCK